MHLSATASHQDALALQGALNFFNLRPAGRMATSVPGRVLNDLLFKVSAAGMPAELMQTLMLMKYDFMRLPPMGTDSSGRSFVSLWLTTRHLSAPPSAPAAGFEGGLATPCCTTRLASFKVICHFLGACSILSTIFSPQTE